MTCMSQLARLRNAQDELAWSKCAEIHEPHECKGQVVTTVRRPAICYSSVEMSNED